MSGRKVSLVVTTEEQLAWLTSSETGISSQTIWCVMTGTDFRMVLGGCRPEGPYDPSDFGRCRDLLNLFPEWKARLEELRPYFKGLVDAWESIDAIYTREIAAGPRGYETWAAIARARGDSKRDVAQIEEMGRQHAAGKKPRGRVTVRVGR